MKQYRGIGVNFGKVFGQVFCYQKNNLGIPHYKISKENVLDEWKRYQNALVKTKMQLLDCQKNMQEKLGENEAEIFEIQLALLEDDYLSKALYKEIEASLCNVEYCLKKVMDTCMHQFKGHEMLHIRESCWDFNDVTSRILKNLLLVIDSPHAKIELKGKIIVASNLEPSDVADFVDKEIAGIVLEEACLTSHAIIMARGLNIPIIVGVEGIYSKVVAGEKILIDGTNGKVFLRPFDWFLEQYLKISEANVKEFKTKKESITVDFWFSYDSHLTGDLLGAHQAKGIGLLRTESVFLSKIELPDEEKQFLFYKSVVEKVAPYPIVLRVLDVGGDKIAKTSFREEFNSFLGVRGIRYCLFNSGIFKKQLRAMLRASAFGKARILYPMITGVEDLLQANALLEECKNELRIEGIPYDEAIPVGAMIEVPSAVLLMEQLSSLCQFFNLGTNDLIQYTLAADRTNSLISKRYSAIHPSFLRMLKIVFENAKNLKIPISVCGEMVSSDIGFLICLAIGFRSFCVYSSQIECLKSILLDLEQEDLSFIFDKIWNFNDSQEIFHFLKNFLNKSQRDKVKALTI